MENKRHALSKTPSPQKASPSLIFLNFFIFIIPFNFIIVAVVKTTLSVRFYYYYDYYCRMGFINNSNSKEREKNPVRCC